MKIITSLIAVSLILFAAWLMASEPIATMRGETRIPDNAEPPIIYQVENKDMMRKRSYPMQPPTIPHKIDHYQVDLNVNKCLSCHSRKQTEDSQAPMVSVTHYMDRDGNFLATVSPRRYFCEQCHVVQHDTKPALKNTFKDIDDILTRKAPEQ